MGAGAGGVGPVASPCLTKEEQMGWRGSPRKKPAPLPRFLELLLKKAWVPWKMKQPSGTLLAAVTRTGPVIPKALAASSQAVFITVGSSFEAAQVPLVISW